MRTGPIGLPLLCVLAVITAAPASAQKQRTLIDNLSVETVARGLNHPWGLAFLPDGRMLVTERPGRLRLVDQDGTVSPPLAGVPRVFAASQGGLLDVARRPRLRAATARSTSATPSRSTAAAHQRWRARHVADGDGASRTCR